MNGFTEPLDLSKKAREAMARQNAAYQEARRNRLTELRPNRDDDAAYREKREKNNIAAKKSRDLKRRNEANKDVLINALTRQLQVYKDLIDSCPYCRGSLDGQKVCDNSRCSSATSSRHLGSPFYGYSQENGALFKKSNKPSNSYALPLQSTNFY